jgi:hypothetical protein
MPDDNWSHEETDDPLHADRRNFYKVEKWSRDGLPHNPVGSLTLNLRCQAIAGTDGLLLTHGTKETFVAN